MSRLPGPKGKGLWSQTLGSTNTDPADSCEPDASYSTSLGLSVLLCKMGALAAASHCPRLDKQELLRKLPASPAPGRRSPSPAGTEGDGAAREPRPPSPLTFSRPQRARTTRKPEARSSWRRHRARTRGGCRRRRQRLTARPVPGYAGAATLRNPGSLPPVGPEDLAQAQAQARPREAASSAHASVPSRSSLTPATRVRLDAPSESWGHCSGSTVTSWSRLSGNPRCAPLDAPHPLIFLEACSRG